MPSRKPLLDRSLSNLTIPDRFFAQEAASLASYPAAALAKCSFSLVASCACCSALHPGLAKLRFCRLVSGKNHRKSSRKPQVRLTPKTVFILGCGIMQIPALRIARDMGWHAAAADGNPEAEGRNLCDSFYHVDLKDTEGLIAVAREIREMRGLETVFTA